MNTANTATPRTIFDGVRDNSPRAIPSPPLNIPRLMPKHFFFAKEGPVGAGKVLTPAQAAQLFNADSFDYSKQYAKHSNIIFEAITKAGIVAEYERVIAPDAKRASLRLWIDVLETTQVPQYRRMPDGTYELNPINQQPIPVASGTTVLPGIIAKFRVTEVDDGFGNATQRAGNQLDQTTGKQSVMYPLIDLQADFVGAAGGLKGIRVWSPTSAGSRPLRSTLLTGSDAYPFRLALVKKVDENSTSNPVPTLTGDVSIDFVLRPNTIDLITGGKTKYHLADHLMSSYQDLSDETQTPIYSPVSGVFVYQANVDTVLDKIAAAEKPYINSFSDLKSDDKNRYRVNLFGATSSTGAPYSTYMIVNNANDSLRISSTTDLMMIGGSDGDLSNASFEQAVLTALGGYTDPFNPKVKPELSPGNLFFDTGYADKVKYALMATKSVRGDTFPFISTAIEGSPELALADELSRGGMLNARALMYSESNVYATPCARLAIFPQVIKTPMYEYNNAMPAYLALLPMLFGYVCDGSNLWNSSKRLDEGEDRYLKQIAYLSNPFLPDPVASQAWLSGLNWLVKVDGGRYTYEALRTVYSTDNSVLTGILFALTVCSTRKVFEQTRVHFSGNTRLTPGEFIKAIDDRNNNALPDIAYDGHAIWKSKSTLTDVDQALGYKWTTVGEAKGSIGRTVQSLTFVVDRL